MGFSYMEAVVASMVLLMGSFPLIMSFRSAGMQMVAARRHYQAGVEAAGMMAHMQSLYEHFLFHPDAVQEPDLFVWLNGERYSTDVFFYQVSLIPVVSGRLQEEQIKVLYSGDLWTLWEVDVKLPQALETLEGVRPDGYDIYIDQNGVNVSDGFTASDASWERHGLDLRGNSGICQIWIEDLDLQPGERFEFFTDAALTLQIHVALEEETSVWNELIDIQQCRGPVILSVGRMSWKREVCLARVSVFDHNFHLLEEITRLWIRRQSELAEW